MQLGHSTTDLASFILSLFLLIIAVFSIDVWRSPSWLAVEDPPNTITIDEINAVARELWCPVCSGVRLDLCELQVCEQMREQIRTHLLNGASAEQIKELLFKQYGPLVLGEPPRSGLNLFAWFVPFAVLAAGVLYLLQLGRNMHTNEVSANLIDAEHQLRRRTSSRRNAIFLFFFVFVGLLAVGLWRQNRSAQRVNGIAADFQFTSFDGEIIGLEELRGQGVVLNFWASWCEPCRSEAALLENTWRREKGNGIVFLGLNYADAEDAALAYLDEFEVTYPNGPDVQSEIYRDYFARGIPETFFIDPKGKIQEVVVGPLLSQSQLDKYIDAIRPVEERR